MINRRQLISRTAVGLGAVGLAGVARADDKTPSAGSIAEDGGLLRKVPFDGVKQSGVLTPAQAQATFAALDITTEDPSQLASALTALSYRARQLCTGVSAPSGAPEEPPSDTGVLGTIVAPDDLTVTISFGHSLFEKVGLQAKRPVHLKEMPRFGNDNIDPAIAGGDILVQIGAGQRDTVVHALRELLRQTRGTLIPRWTLDGFSAAARGPKPNSTPRNLFAFRDGTANPDVHDDKLMNQLVWTQRGAEPGWAVGGTYQVVRIIRMHVEFWDRVGLREQENMIGRHRDTGAPLGGTDEFQDPRYDTDPKGNRIPLDAHIRTANPRTPKTDDQRILRRGFNYTRGLDAAASLDQGLIFVAYNQDPDRQFATIQRRLDDEPMVDYITPVGGGYFYAPPGTGSAKGGLGWVGQALFA